MSIKVLGRRVLVEQKAVKKESKIIRLDKASENGLNKEEENFDYFFKIVGIGEECPPTIKIGDVPIFGQFRKFNTVKIVEKTNKLSIVHAIIDYDFIEAVEEEVKEN